MASRFTYPDKETRRYLGLVINKLLKHKRGLLTADEGPHTMGKRFKKLGIKNTEENRQCYRQLLFSADPEINKMISGIVLHDETVRQKAECGTPFPRFIRECGVIPGIRLNTGFVPIYGSPKERVPEGLDHLRERCCMYKEKGIEFAKFRGCIRIGKHRPTNTSIRENAECLAKYASMCQANCMVPVIQPEVLPHGHHDIIACQKVTETFISEVIKALHERHVSMQHIILNPSMVIPGYSCKDKEKYTCDEIARRTCRTMARVVPPAVPGICFSSSGLSEEMTTVILNKMIQCKKAVKPWKITFGCGRGLQASAMTAWCGEQKNIDQAKREFLKRLQAYRQATCGTYEEGSVKGVASELDLFA